MSNERKLPSEVVQFEWMLKKPNGDPTGLAGFFNSGEIIVTRVPARLDVMGGISDYSGANVCEGVLGGGMVIALQPRTDRTLRIRTMQANRVGLPVETRIPLDYFEMGNGFVSYEQMGALCRSNPLSAWAAYIGGSIFTLLKEQSIHLPFGFNLFLLSGVPMNVGIGSSAATEIATLYCLQNYLQLALSETDLARLGQLAENLVVGAPCGIMDQITVTSGRQGKLTHILCRPGSIMREVEIPAGTAFVGINSMVKHSVGGAAYSDVRIGAFIGKRIINAVRAEAGGKPLQYLSELTPEDFEKNYRACVPETIIGSDFLTRYQSHDDPITRIQPDATYRVAGPTAHPVYENDRVLKFMDHLLAADERSESELVAAGECMLASHYSYRDNCQLSVPEVDFIVEAVRSRGAPKGLYGAKITGGGSGGTVAVFGSREGLDAELPGISRDYKRLTGLEADIFDGSSPGAVEFGSYRYTFGPMGWIRFDMLIRKAVIPIAGLGTRLFPASQACKKEFFPVVGPDGIARALLHYQVNDLLATGIEQICIIVQPGEERLVIDYFQGPGEAFIERLAGRPAQASEARAMQAALERISFAEQASQEGYGHAVYQARLFAGDEPFLLCLGDHLFRGRQISCHTRLVEAYELCGGKALSAVNRIRADELKGYGTIAGRRTAGHPELVEVAKIIEKPAVAVARAELRVDGLGDDEWLGWFGMHVLPPAIFTVLEEMIRRDVRQKGEFQLTYAQELLRQREGYFALEMRDGKRFDFGTPADFVKSIAAFAQAD